MEQLEERRSGDKTHGREKMRYMNNEVIWGKRKAEKKFMANLVRL